MKPQAAAGNAMGGMARAGANQLQSKMAARVNSKNAKKQGMALGMEGKPAIGGLGNKAGMNAQMIQQRLAALRANEAAGGRTDFDRPMPNLPSRGIPAFGNPNMDLDTGMMPGGNPFASRENTITANIPSRQGGMGRPGGMNPFSERLRQTGYNPAMMNSAVAKLRPTGMSDMSSGPPPIRATNPNTSPMDQRFQQMMAMQRLGNMNRGF